MRVHIPVLTGLNQSGEIRPGLIMVIMATGLTMLVVIWLTSGLVGADKWPIRWLDITGPMKRVNADRIRSVLESEVSGGFFTIDLDRVRYLTEEIPWVSSVQARTLWPDTIEVRVLEYDAVAHWGSDQLISSDGVAFAVPAAGQIQGLPYLAGSEDKVAEVVTFWQQANTRLAALSLSVKDLRLRQRGAWELRLNTDTRVLLGREDLLPRLQRLVANWQALSANGRRIPQSIDLRYTNGFAVKWQQES